MIEKFTSLVYKNKKFTKIRRKEKYQSEDGMRFCSQSGFIALIKQVNKNYVQQWIQYALLQVL